MPSIKTILVWAISFAPSVLSAAVPVKRAISSVVSGTPPGFAGGATGGGNAKPVYPTTIADLKKYLTSKDPQVIVISGQFNFAGSEGTQTLKACNTYQCTPEKGGQAMLNTLNGCTTATYDVKIDTAAYQGINVQSNKTLVGKNGATLNGKGLRLVGVSNIIIQNIKITNLNPKYVWGGDAITMSGTHDIWIDHVETSLTGRQHYSFGQTANHWITISNSFINGKTTNSASCDGHTYWGEEMVGVDDSITWYKNYVYMTNGRSPALSGGTLLHAVNNVFDDNTGHLIEGGDANARGIFEGNVFKNIKTTVDAGFKGKLFGATSANAASCKTALGRNCQANAYTSAPALNRADTAFFTQFNGFSIVGAATADSIAAAVPKSAGNTL
ncbi:polysaccharide lyase family 1 protein [Karstenula rhodostoma CBS 690.94]|uniref:pectin lyase n=1 Tax=Karstenula rhodostoma CBS 690.94 TaxID=1392251 RepID=A0A9P4UC36_9PLEO|nr:polysaccharide lyase family 1 protein [Karstenula rhodostoma CBS 690.94]